MKCLYVFMLLPFVLAGCATTNIDMSKQDLLASGSAKIYMVVSSGEELDSRRFMLNFKRTDVKESDAEKLKHFIQRGPGGKLFADVGGHCIGCVRPMSVEGGRMLYVMGKVLPAGRYIVGASFYTASMNAWVTFSSKAVNEIELKPGMVVYLGNAKFEPTYGKNMFGHQVPSGGYVEFSDRLNEDGKYVPEGEGSVGESGVFNASLNGRYRIGAEE